MNMTDLTKHPNHGTSLDDFLREEGILEETTAHALKSVIAWQLQEEMKKHKLTKVAMAKRMNTTRSQLDRVLNPDDGNITIETLQRARQGGRPHRTFFADMKKRRHGCPAPAFSNSHPKRTQSSLISTAAVLPRSFCNS